MADPATMMVAGAAIGAATNKKNPLEGAMMGAALGGGGGYLLGGAPLVGGGAPLVAAEGAAGLGAAEGAAEGLLGSVGPTAYPVPDVGAYPFESAVDYWKMNSGPGDIIDVAGKDFDLFGAITGQPMPYYQNEMMDASMGRAMTSGANETLDAELGKAQREAIAAKTRSFNPMMAMQAMNLAKPQEQPIMRGGITRGDPRAVQQDAVLSLLAPKRLEKRKISLMG